jgi:3-methyladenine DNA glycosylase/8-oxoguanine DNA glycosylase
MDEFSVEFPSSSISMRASSSRRRSLKRLCRATSRLPSSTPSNANYTLAADVARSHAVTALIQAAAKDRFRRDAAAERAALTHALELDPRNIQVTEHLHELGDDAVRGQATPPYEQAANTVAAAGALYAPCRSAQLPFAR